jgi:uncharacterized repeat protein (TIGR04076 family)
MLNERRSRFKITAKIVKVKGHCNAEHKEGDSFEIDCYKTAGLCGYFYHNLFPTLLSFQIGAQAPWWKNKNKIQFSCPDLKNMVTIELVRAPRE